MTKPTREELIDRVQRLVIAGLDKDLIARLKADGAEIQQLQDRLTCMCGDYVDGHGLGSGHSPVSMYDYSLSNAKDEIKRLRELLDCARAEYDGKFGRIIGDGSPHWSVQARAALQEKPE